MAGFQQLRVTRKVDFTGATQIGVGTPYLGAGKVYFVDKDNGSDGYEGTNPNYPLKKVQAAVDKCVTDNNDYVFILAAKDEDTTAITNSNDIRRVHLIGVSNPQATFGVVFRSTSDTEDALLCAGGAFGYSEIAGISFGGGATSKGGIGLGQTIGLWVHHCVFGHSFCGDTPAYGIYRTAQANCENTLIEDCIFYGDQANAQGKLAEEAIYMTGATPSKNLIIRRNTFMGIGGAACNISSTGGMILDNIFMIPDAETGEAITIDVDGIDYSKGCLIKGNIAANGMLNAGYTYNPYRDLQTNTYNAWTMNYRGNAVIEPVGV